MYNSIKTILMFVFILSTLHASEDGGIDISLTNYQNGQICCKIENESGSDKYIRRIDILAECADDKIWTTINWKTGRTANIIGKKPLKPALIPPHGHITYIYNPNKLKWSEQRRSNWPYNKFSNYFQPGSDIAFTIRISIARDMFGNEELNYTSKACIIKLSKQTRTLE